MEHFMSVFARFLRRSKKAAPPTAGRADGTDGVAADPSQAPGSETGSETGTAAAEATGDAPAPAGSEQVEPTPPASVAERGGPTETVEIPKQQSAERAADNEAGEGARK
jgi:hypothetical protein